MIPQQPPRLATWMLKHFGSGLDNETLLGDLAEQYRENGNAMWYWRQAMKAIPVSLFKEVRAHKWIAARALLTGWIMWIVGSALIFPLVFVGTNLGYDFEPRYPIATAWSFMFMPVLGHYPYPYGLWSGFDPLGFGIVLPLIVGTMCGWAVARFHRGQQTAVVLLFTGSILLVDLLLFGSVLHFIEARVVYAISGPLPADVAASTLGILLGGGLLRDKSNIVTN
jgi:hypothetical protein